LDWYRKPFDLSVYSMFVLDWYRKPFDLSVYSMFVWTGTRNHSTYLYTQCLFGLVHETIRLICILNVCLDWYRKPFD